ncbi:cupin domain-containing protein [Hymenobacter crusticola]|uniref:Cupin n=1 Tax=Hymenobacter crusticola TaxID=1770526 RepID=A0A243W8G4_9BACT|nr:cupin domain-containing protein [Hymenobacter crusticola]OUJ71612.1 cupin [Hymenobacter crusticola]
MDSSQTSFSEDSSLSWENVGGGVQRKILVYNADLMMVKVAFEASSIGAIHQHVHTQITYVESGVFEATVDGQQRVLRAGDTFLASSNVWHGVVCQEAGVLVDVFNPMREDFV